MQHEVEYAFEIGRKELVQEALKCVLQEELEMTWPAILIMLFHVFHLPPFLCLLYFDYRHYWGSSRQTREASAARAFPRAA